LGAGISDGLGYGGNAKAALITRGLAEIARLGASLGASPLTCLGLPGVGGLIVTCTSHHRRTWRGGSPGGKGQTVEGGIDRMGRLVAALGARPLTFLGLPGVGNLIVTCTSHHSRNWRAGNLLGKGQKIDEVLEQMGMVVEGVRTTKAAYQFASAQQIEMPITEGLYDILFNDKKPKDVVEQLMNRNKRDEMDDITSFLRANFAE